MNARRRSAFTVAMLLASTFAVDQAVSPGTADAACDTTATLDAAQLNTVFAQPGTGRQPGAEGFGGGDYPHAYPVPGGKVLWLFQDIYFSDDNNLNSPLNNAAHNAGLIQQGSCFRVLGSRGADFIGDALTADSKRWFWPLDGEIGYDGNLFIFMAEMFNPTGNGATLGAAPVGTWLAVVDPLTFQVLSFAPAPNSGTGLYGWSVVSDDQYSYLYGFCDRQFIYNVAGPGQFDSSCMPNSYLARVPLGHFEVAPQYWNGSSWTPNAGAAVPVMSRAAANPMSVQWFGNVFVSVTKLSEWWGTAISVDRAPSPQGPWQVAQTINVLADRKCGTCGNYGAFLMPWLDDHGDMTIALSNGGDFALWRANAFLYRPTFYSVAVPNLTPPSTAASAPAFPLVQGVAGFVAVDPLRLVDTRKPAQEFDRLQGGVEAVIDLTARGMPAGTTAVALNLTTVDPAATGWVRVYPCAASEPPTSNVNPVIGQVQTNAVIVSVGDGHICLRSAADVDVIVDLNGWLTEGSDVGLFPVAPRRLVDTRSSLGGTSRLQAGQVVEVEVVAPSSNAVAVALNVTAVDPSLSGFVTAWPCGIDRPVVSNLNPQAHVTRPNFVNVRVGVDRKVCLYSSVGMDLLVDLFAEYRPGAVARYASLAPQRILDTRIQSAPLHQSNLSFVLPMGSIVAAQVNLTATRENAPGYLTGYRCMTDKRPGTSNVNYVTSVASANSALLTNSRGYACVFHSSSTQLVVDIFGVWTN